MRRRRIAALLSFPLLLIGGTAAAEEPAWTPEQRELLAAIDRLSASTAPGGGGPEEYAAVLAEDFSRWTLGSDNVSGKSAWVAGVREWFDDGWRVSDRESRVLEVRVLGALAFVRRVVGETYTGPDGESSRSKAALAEVWTRQGEEWKLLRVEVHTLD